MVVHELGEVVVALVGIAAAAVGIAATDRDVVVAGDALDVVVEEQRPDRVALGPEAAEVTEAEDPLAPPSPRVGEHRP